MHLHIEQPDLERLTTDLIGATGPITALLLARLLLRRRVTDSARYDHVEPAYIDLHAVAAKLASMWRGDWTARNAREPVIAAMPGLVDLRLEVLCSGRTTVQSVVLAEQLPEHAGRWWEVRGAPWMAMPAYRLAAHWGETIERLCPHPLAEVRA